MNWASALSFLPSLFSVFSSAPSGGAGFGRGGLALADPVADVGDRIEAAHVLLLEEIDGVALALGEERDEDVGAGHFVAARGLDVEDGALDDALEARGRGRVGGAVGDERAELMVEILLDRGAQLVAVDAAGGHHLGRMLVVDQRDEQMLERGIFVAALARFAERIVQGLFESRAKLGIWDQLLHARANRAGLLEDNVIWRERGNQGPAPRFSTE